MENEFFLSIGLALVKTSQGASYLKSPLFKLKLQHRWNSFSTNQEPLQTCTIPTSKVVHWLADFLFCS